MTLDRVAPLQRGFDLPESKREPGTIPVITSAGQSGFHSAWKVRGPGVVLGRYGTIGDIHFVEEDFWPHNTTLWVTDFHGNDPQFVAYLLSSIEFAQYSDKTGVPGVNRNDLHSIKILVPPVEEQRAINCVLLTWDCGIRQLSDLIAAKLRFKQGLMQQLLTGGRRFPEFTDDWDRRSIGSFLVESRIPGTHGAEAKKLTVKLYGKGVIPKTETRAGSIATKYYRRKVGQFIYSKLDFLNGAFGIVPTELDGFESTLDLPAFDISDSVDPDWFRFFVVRESFYKNLLGLANGGRKARRVNPDDLLKVSIPFPAKPEQSRIADMLNAADREIDLLRKKLDALKTQKKGLMQKLLTGQVRVASGGR